MFSRLTWVGRWSRLKNILILSSRKSSRAKVRSMTNSNSRIRVWSYYGGELPEDPFGRCEPVMIIPKEKVKLCPAAPNGDTARGRRPIVNNINVSPLQRKVVGNLKPLPVPPPIRQVRVKKRTKLHENLDNVSHTLNKAKPQGQSDFGYFQEQPQEEMNYDYVSSREAKREDSSYPLPKTNPEYISALSNESALTLLDHQNLTTKGCRERRLACAFFCSFIFWHIDSHYVAIICRCRCQFEETLKQLSCLDVHSHAYPNGSTRVVKY